MCTCVAAAAPGFLDRRPDVDKNEDEVRRELAQLREVWHADQQELKKLHKVRVRVVWVGGPHSEHQGQGAKHCAAPGLPRDEARCGGHTNLLCNAVVACGAGAGG